VARVRAGGAGTGPGVEAEGGSKWVIHCCGLPLRHALHRQTHESASTRDVQGAGRAGGEREGGGERARVEEGERE
jgi:hypothetical protein